MMAPLMSLGARLIFDTGPVGYARTCFKCDASGAAKYR